MKKKLTSVKNYAPACKNCVHGRLSPDETLVLCKKAGVSEPDSSCRSFKYDPLKRVPKRAPLPENADPAEFEL